MMHPALAELDAEQMVAHSSAAPLHPAAAAVNARKRENSSPVSAVAGGASPIYPFIADTLAISVARRPRG
jgi:hypothetical protein